MDIILFLIIGALVGWLASHILGRDEGLLMSIVIGIVGAFIGSFVSRLLTGADQSYLDFNLSNLIWALVGALIFVGILNALGKSRHTS